MSDPTRLFVKATGATNPLDQKFDIFQTVNNTRVNLCGFSYFGELGGININTATSGIDLRGPGDAAPNPPVKPPKYSLTFAEYMDKLRGAKVNLMRIFLFEEYEYRYYPFTRDVEEGKFNLHKINPAYISRLKNFVETARARGIIVCISFFSKRSLQSPGFAAVNPFYFEKNNNDLLVDDQNNPVTVGINEICKIEQPPAPNTLYNPGWTARQRLWWIQRNFITQIVNATKDYWNVTYEPFNEPFSRIPGVIDWFVTVTTWLKNLLWDPSTNRRSRLVSINAGDDLVDNVNFLSRLLPANQPPLFDVFDFHGGGAGVSSQWGGPTGTGTGKICPLTPPPPAQLVDQIIHGATDDGRHQRGILEAMDRFKTRPVALIFNTDAHYWAQRLVTPYLEEVLNVDGSFSYRWSFDFLNAVSDLNCNNQLLPTSSGLDQRLAKISAARNKGRITVF